MSWIHTITVQLQIKAETGTDALNRPTYTTTWEDVDGVLFGRATSEEVVNTYNLYGKKIVGKLAIPKGDTHTWEDTLVRINGEVYRTIGHVIEEIEENMPLEWHKEVRVERYVESES